MLSSRKFTLENWTELQYNEVKSYDILRFCVGHPAPITPSPQAGFLSVEWQ